ncbi:MAG: guanylate kinase [Armatimonadetes bacterium]|nr:guanylate kinase [Armatimonadota bacterium]
MPGSKIRREGLLLVVSGPSGVGKGTLINGLLQRHPELRVSVSCTTRPPRPGEVNGRDYYFVSTDEFLRMRAAGELLEWAVVHQDTFYGTPRKPVEEAILAGEDMVLEIDYQGARAIRGLLAHHAVLVFIAPPSWHALVDRLQRRHTERPEDVAKRLASARREIANIAMFQYVVINDVVEEAVDELEAILLAERCRLGRVDWRGLARDLLRQSDGAAYDQ